MEGLEAFWRVNGSFLIENKGNLGGGISSTSHLKHVKQTKTYQKSSVPPWVCVWPFDREDGERLRGFIALQFGFCAGSELCQSWWGWAVTPEASPEDFPRDLEPLHIPMAPVRQSDDAPSPQPSVLSGQQQTLICLSSWQFPSISRGAGRAQSFLRFGVQRQTNFEGLDH